LRWKPLLAVVLVLAVLVAGLWIVFFSAVLAAESVRITGNGFLTTGQIRSTAAVPIGRPLARVDLGEVEHRVESLAPVRTVTVTRSWPHTVVIRVTERKPVAVVDLGGDIRGMDDQGVVFRQYAKAPPGLPLVKTTGRTGGEALQEAARVVGSLPASLVGRVDHLAVVTVDQIWLVLRDHRVVLWGSADESAQKAEVLGALLKEPAKSYDVSVPGQPTTSQRPPRTPVP
jgi:cell division protein FtsQ